MDSSAISGYEPPRDFDRSVPHSARVWNYWLGGKDNFQADREVGDRIRAVLPGVVDAAHGARGFLIRAVRYLAGDAGVRQFLDIGTGLPTGGNTHEVAQETASECRVVYVDNDPLVLVHARALLTSSPEGVTDYVAADLRDPGTILREAARTLDFTQPVALLLMGVVNHITDTDEAHAIVDRLLDALPAGSYLVLSHSTSEVGGAAMDEAIRQWNAAATPPMTVRSRQEINRFFDRLELLEPGVVSDSLWRPDPHHVGVLAEVDHFGGVGRKP